MHTLTLLSFLNIDILPLTLKEKDPFAALIAERILNEKISHNNVLNKGCIAQVPSWCRDKDRKKLLTDMLLEILNLPAEHFFNNSYIYFEANMYAKYYSRFTEQFKHLSFNDSDHEILLEVLSSLFAIRLLIEARRNKIGFPHEELSDLELQNDFIQLQKTPKVVIRPNATINTSQFRVGTSCSTYYMQENMSYGSIESHHSKYEIFHDDQNLFSRIRSHLKDSSKTNRNAMTGVWLNKSQLRSMFKLNFMLTNFNPMITLNVIHTLREHDKSFQITEVADFCGGFGGRLTGFLADPHLKYIFINDVNTKLTPCYQSIIALANRADPKTLEKRVVLSQMRAEQLEYNHRYDLIHTCPPYFTKEKYSDDKNQSISQFPNFDDWINGFLKPAVRLAFENIKLNGYFAISLGDIRSRKGVNRRGIYPIVDEFDTFVRNNFKLNFIHWHPFQQIRSSILKNGIAIGRFGEIIVAVPRNNHLQLDTSSKARVELIDEKQSKPSLNDAHDSGKEESKEEKKPTKAKSAPSKRTRKESTNSTNNKRRAKQVAPLPLASATLQNQTLLSVVQHSMFARPNQNMASYFQLHFNANIFPDLLVRDIEHQPQVRQNQVEEENIKWLTNLLGTMVADKYSNYLQLQFTKVLLACLVRNTTCIDIMHIPQKYHSFIDATVLNDVHSPKHQELMQAMMYAALYFNAMRLFTFEFTQQLPFDANRIEQESKMLKIVKDALASLGLPPIDESSSSSSRSMTHDPYLDCFGIIHSIVWKLINTKKNSELHVLEHIIVQHFMSHFLNSYRGEVICVDEYSSAQKQKLQHILTLAQDYFTRYSERMTLAFASRFVS